MESLNESFRARFRVLFKISSLQWDATIHDAPESGFRGTVINYKEPRCHCTASIVTVGLRISACLRAAVPSQ